MKLTHNGRGTFGVDNPLSVGERVGARELLGLSQFAAGQP
jgi:hypothetical protein